MSEEELQQRIKKLQARLQEDKKEQDIEFARLEGMLEGIRSGKLNEMQRRFIDIIELITAGQKGFFWNAIETTEFRIDFIEFKLSTLKSITNLETEVNQLRDTLDKLHEMK